MHIEETTEKVIETSYDSISTKIIKFKAQIKNSDLKNAEIEAYQYFDENVAVNPKEIEVGDKILVLSLDSRYYEGEKEWTFIEYYRTDTLIILLASFSILLIMLGRRKGINTILSLIISCLSIFVVYIPLILKGNNIYFTSIIICVFIVLVSLLLINGFNKKTFCAIIGNLGGVIVAGLLSYILGNILNLTGFIDSDSAFLLMIDSKNPIDLKAILWSSIVIGSLGAVMDVFNVNCISLKRAG